MGRVKTIVVVAAMLLLSLAVGCGGEPMVSATITGGFVAKVHLLLPNYAVDNVTLSEAVVTEFQCGPFIVSVKPPLAAQLQTDEWYFFEIEPKEIGEISQREFELGCQNIEAAIATHNLHIVGVRLAQEDEKGMLPTRMIYEAT